VIHEQNSFPGLSNRILGKFVNRIFISYDESRSFFPEGRTVFTGVPLRQQIRERPVPARDALFTVAVLGGSQGSHEINRAMATAVPHLLPIKDRVRIIHQSGSGDEAMLGDVYQKFGFNAHVTPFIDDMIATYGKAHLLISRAGAATLAEIALCGRAAILIPYPFAANNHQEKNARVFAERGAALMIRSPELSGERLAQAILDSEQHRDRLEQMGKQARTLAQPQAAQMIVDICYEEAAKRKKP
jgi:UDP-N-acetylglucosamine--N-acetylmuramyl-(pentapeptide) pyrophosphoryl-undecaprenol N-acetylglucosamine transferase